MEGNLVWTKTRKPSFSTKSCSRWQVSERARREEAVGKWIAMSVRISKGRSDSMVVFQALVFDVLMRKAASRQNRLIFPLIGKMRHIVIFKKRCAFRKVASRGHPRKLKSSVSLHCAHTTNAMRYHADCSLLTILYKRIRLILLTSLNKVYWKSCKWVIFAEIRHPYCIHYPRSYPIYKTNINRKLMRFLISM
jgi:hypothetical protein